MLAATMALIIVVATTPALAQFDGFFDPSFGDIFCYNDTCANGFFFDNGAGTSQNGEPQSGLVTTSHQASDSGN